MVVAFPRSIDCTNPEYFWADCVESFSYLANRRSPYSTSLLSVAWKVMGRPQNVHLVPTIEWGWLNRQFESQFFSSPLTVFLFRLMFPVVAIAWVRQVDTEAFWKWGWTRTIALSGVAAQHIFPAPWILLYDCLPRSALATYHTTQGESAIWWRCPPIARLSVRKVRRSI